MARDYSKTERRPKARSGSQPNDLPVLEDEGKVVRVIAGALLGVSSPVSRRARCSMQILALEPANPCRSILITMSEPSNTVWGEVEIAGDTFGPGQLLVFRSGDRITIRANTDARFMALGGEPMDGPRTSSGILYPPEKIASNRPKPIGRWHDLTQFPAIPSSLRFPNPTPDGSLLDR
jgi:redox-sensitive bicupin YhaK (pirin superfamily)